MKTIAALFAAAALAAPTLAAAQPTLAMEPPTNSYETDTTYNAPIFTSGALVFASSYGASIAVAATHSDSASMRHLYVPVVGPWLALNSRPDCDSPLVRCDHESGKKVALVADGLFQAAGVVTMLDGLFTRSKRPSKVARLDAKLYHPRPIRVGADSSPGLGFSGKF